MKTARTVVNHGQDFSHSYYGEKKNSPTSVAMAFWTTQFHKSDADNDLSQTIDRINDAVVRVRVVLGNDDTENILVRKKLFNFKVFGFG